MIAAVALFAALTITPTARAMQPGELVVLTVTSTTPLTAVHARVFGTDIDGFEDDPLHWGVLVGIDIEGALGKQAVGGSGMKTRGATAGTNGHT